MLKFIWGRGQGPTAERVKLQKELFNFSKNVTYGFPSKPACIDWDPELRLLAVGTKGGALRVFGAPGVELLGQHEGEEITVLRVLFVPGQGRLVTLTSDNSLHLWQIDGSSLLLRHSVLLEGRLKTVSALCLESSRKKLLIGTEGGNIYQLRLRGFCLEEEIIYQDLLMRTVPDNYKLNPGAVEALLERPGEPNQLVVGYTRGLVLLWDRAASCCLATFVSQQQLESVVWRSNSQNIVSAHNDGSFVVWDAESGEQTEPPNTPYGPYPCKAISKMWSSTGWNIFAGGMPRASYGDKFTVTVMREEGEGVEERHTVLDLTSKITDFLVIEQEGGRPDYLIILSEEELVCIDLVSPTWPIVEPPYMQSIHSSAITTITQVNDVNNQVVESLEGLGAQTGSSAARSWPVTGGEGGPEAGGAQTVIITGHEDGSVKFWMSRENLLTHLTTLATGKFFKGEDDLDSLDGSREDDDEEEEWPPFRRVGSFDPYSDDPRLAVKKVLFCGDSGVLVVGGTAGQVLVCTVGEQKEASTSVCKAETVTEKEGFTWKGHKALELRSGALQLPSGFQPTVVLQISPPASITSLSLSKQWGVVACGTAHGVVVLDYYFQHVVTARSTLSSADIANADDNPMSRKKSLKKSLRESFRRLRKGRSQAAAKGKEGVEGKTDSPRERAPMERQVEARGQKADEDGLGSMVRCLHFASTYIRDINGVSPTLWAGTNTGQVLVFLLTITPVDKRKNDKITAVLAKEIQLKHKAPVIDIEVHDAGGLPVSGNQPSYPAPHRVLITSEEQFKLFLLPQLKPCGKYKLTAHEGIRVRRVKSATFASTRDADYTENCLVYLANSGEIGVLSLPELRRQVSSAAVRKEDVVGISSLSFSNTGNGVYLSSSSELQQISLSARHTVAAGGGRVEVDRREEEEGGEGDTDSQADRQNRQNEMEAGRGGGKSPRGEGGDPHNETAMSEVSGDITLDSIRDHMSATLRSEGGDGVAATSTEVTVTERELGGGRRETVETVSRTVETITLSTTQQVVPGNALVANGTSTNEDEGDTTLTA